MIYSMLSGHPPLILAFIYIAVWLRMQKVKSFDQGQTPLSYTAPRITRRTEVLI